jgi:hypothetical protein
VRYRNKSIFFYFDAGVALLQTKTQKVKDYHFLLSEVYGHVVPMYEYKSTFSGKKGQIYKSRKHTSVNHN